MEKTNLKVLGFLPLLAVVVGSIVGAGIFNSPADLGKIANPGWVFVAWMITGVGVFSLVRVFQYLGDSRPELEGGVYTYAREAAGEFVGFNSSYGYWWSTLFTNLAYLFAIPKILGYYFPLFAANKWAAFILASIMLWGYYFLIRAGIRAAGLANVIITILKLTPLLFVVGVTIFMFKPSLMSAPFGLTLSGTGESAGIWRQVGGSFGVMMFAFLGIESAVVISGKARHSRDIGRVTFIGFLVTLTIYVLVSTLTMGVAPAREIVDASSPLGAVLGYAIGDFGRHFLNFGFLFSIAGALLSWLLLTAEAPYISAVHDGAFPRAFARVNSKATPVFSLTVTSVITQGVLLLLYGFSASPDITAGGNAPLLQNLYFAAINLSVICCLAPYVLSSVLSCRSGWREKKRGPVVFGVISILFFLWVFISMMKYLAPAIIVYASGAVFRFLVHRERGESFPRAEGLFYLILGVSGLVLAWLIIGGAFQF